MDRAVDEVVAAERWRGVGYLLVGSGIAAIVWEVVRRRRWRARRFDHPGGDATRAPVGLRSAFGSDVLCRPAPGGSGGIVAGDLRIAPCDACATAASSERSRSRAVVKTAEHPSNRKDGPHGCLHPARWADLQQKARAHLVGVAHTMQGAAGNLDALALPQLALLSAELDAECSLQDLHPLVLAQVEMARNTAARVQQDLGLKQLPARLLAGLAELQVLTSEGVMQYAHRRLLAALH
jgi:hypothetical protein